jgi:hypothetical protein
MGDFEALITVKGRPYLSFVATKRGGLVSSTSIYRYNQLHPGRLDHIPEYIVTNTPPNSHYITLGGNVINSLSDITDIIGNDTGSSTDTVVDVQDEQVIEDPVIEEAVSEGDLVPVQDQTSTIEEPIVNIE